MLMEKCQSTIQWRYNLIFLWMKINWKCSFLHLFKISIKFTGYQAKLYSNEFRDVNVSIWEWAVSVSKIDFKYRKHYRDLTKKLLELIKEVSKVAGYKINTQKSVVNFYTLVTKTEIKKTIPFTTASKRIKYLGINLTKKVKDLYSENCKTLVQEIENNGNKWKDCAHESEELIL